MTVGTLTGGPLLPAIPEMWLAASACLILLCDVYFRADHRRGLTATLTMVALTVGVALTSQYGLSMQRILLFNGLYVDDPLAGFRQREIATRAARILIVFKRFQVDLRTANHSEKQG